MKTEYKAPELWYECLTAQEKIAGLQGVSSIDTPDGDDFGNLF